MHIKLIDVTLYFAGKYIDTRHVSLAVTYIFITTDYNTQKMEFLQKYLGLA